jgi:hypothetical protein
MGDHADGVGRVTMHGKTCEVKVAEPKNPVEKTTRGRPGVCGPFGYPSSIHHEDPVYALPPYHHHHHHHPHPPYPPFVADPMIAGWMEYPTVPAPYQGYPGAMAGYMAPMYYPTDNSMTPTYYPTTFPTMPMPMTNAPMVPVTAPMVPPANYVAPFPAYYHTGHAYPYPYPTEEANLMMRHHHHPYAVCPLGMASPMPPAAAPPAQQTSVIVRQPVAPVTSIPVNEEVPSNAGGGAEGGAEGKVPL